MMSKTKGESYGSKEHAKKLQSKTFFTYVFQNIYNIYAGYGSHKCAFVRMDIF